MDGHSFRSDVEGRILHCSRFDARNGERLTTSVLMALDEIPGCDVESEEFVAFEHVDPDALDALFDGNSSGTGQVTFPVDEYEITATAAGDIAIRAR